MGVGARLAGLWQDVRGFVLARPPRDTLVLTATRAERADMSRRIQQRLGIDVTTYSILNVHRIAIDVPGRDVFARLMDWDGDSAYWPNHLARATRPAGRLGVIEIHLCGLHRIAGVGVRPLFRLRAEKIQVEPDPRGPDRARYVLYACEGGYPIGHFAMYVRSSLPALGEDGPTQVFLAVGFNVYGRRRLARRGPARLVTALWERLHNRVTSHVLCRLRAICEGEHGKVGADR